MKYLLLFYLIFITLEAQCQQVKFTPYVHKGMAFLLTQNFDTLKNKSYAIDSIEKAFNVKRTILNKGAKYYVVKDGHTIYRYSFITSQTKLDSPKTVVLDGEKRELKTGDSMLLYGVQVFIPGERKLSGNYAQFLLSAYVQETNEIYRNNPANFIRLPKKSNAEFWKKNFINMGYGQAYATKNNPFTSGRNFTVASFYVIEALHYIPIFGAPFYADTKEDKILIPVVCLSSLLVWKTVISGLAVGKKTLKIYNRAIDNKYHIPNTIKY